MKINKEFERNLDTIRNSIITATENFEIWWIYKSDRPEYVDIMNNFFGFFSNSIHAHFNAFLLSICKVLDEKAIRKKRNISLFTLINLADEKKLLSKNIIKACKSELSRHENVIKKLMVLRSNYFAHLSKKLSYDRMLKKAEITPDEMKKLIDIAGSVVNQLSYAYNKSSLASFDVGAKKDTYLMLDLLLKNR